VRSLSTAKYLARHHIDFDRYDRSGYGAVCREARGQDLVRLLEDVRRRTVALLEDLDDEVMHRSLDPVLSTLVWDPAHIAPMRIWCVHRLGGEPLLCSDLAETYDAFPRAPRGKIELLDRPATRAYLDDVRPRTLEVFHCTGSQHLHVARPAPRAPAHRDDAPSAVSRPPAG